MNMQNFKQYLAEAPEFLEVLKIINAHKDNIIQCQEELFKNNFDVYAKT